MNKRIKHLFKYRTTEIQNLKYWLVVFTGASYVPINIDIIKIPAQFYVLNENLKIEYPSVFQVFSYDSETNKITLLYHKTVTDDDSIIKLEKVKTPISKIYINDDDYSSELFSGVIQTDDTAEITLELAEAKGYVKISRNINYDFYDRYTKKFCIFQKNSPKITNVIPKKKRITIGEIYSPTSGVVALNKKTNSLLIKPISNSHGIIYIPTFSEPVIKRTNKTTHEITCIDNGYPIISKPETLLDISSAARFQDELRQKFILVYHMKITSQSVPVYNEKQGVIKLKHDFLLEFRINNDINLEKDIISYPTYIEAGDRLGFIKKLS